MVDNAGSHDINCLWEDRQLRDIMKSVIFMKSPKNMTSIC